MKATLYNLITHKLVEVEATLDSPDSSYGLYAWRDKDGQSYGQVLHSPPLGFQIVAVTPEPGDPEDLLRQAEQAGLPSVIPPYTTH